MGPIKSGNMFAAAQPVDRDCAKVSGGSPQLDGQHPRPDTIVRVI
jgi:hypothetical protein